MHKENLFANAHKSFSHFSPNFAFRVNFFHVNIQHAHDRTILDFDVTLFVSKLLKTALLCDFVDVRVLLDEVN